MSLITGAQALVGGTPVVELGRFSAGHGLSVPVCAKLEFFNPLSSVKDRLALALIDDAEARGLLGPGGVIVEPTSGNTGIGLAFVGAARGYRVLIAMPESMSAERRAILGLLGAELHLTPAAEGMAGAIEAARRLAESTPGACCPMQFENPAGPDCHERTTGPEILRDMAGDIDVFVCGVGTGGTLTGVAKALKRHNPDVLIAAVEPEASPVLSGGRPGKHGIQGIGAGFIPKILDLSLIGEIVRVSDGDALDCARALGRLEGLLVGISSGAAACAAVRLARKYPGRRVVTLFPDTGERYLSGMAGATPGK